MYIAHAVFKTHQQTMKQNNVDKACDDFKIL